MTNKIVERGDLVRDTITGYKGVVLCRAVWLNGCVRFVVQSQELKDGAMIAAETIDEQQLVVVKKAVATAVQDPGAPQARPTTGGPTPAPQRHAAPRR